MTIPPADMILKHFASPDETRTMIKGVFQIVRLGGVTLGRATYEPGWKWSEHVGAQLGQRLCSVEHLVMVISGAAALAFEHGRVMELRPGDIFYVPPVPHDSWVLGNEPYISIHFLGAGHYAR